MKTYHLIAIFALTTLSFACQDEETPSPSNNCSTFENGLILLDEVVVEEELNDLCQGFPPVVPTADDLLGHEANLNAIIMKLMDNCENITTTLGCYACLESNPPQSVVNFTLDSAGVEVHRSIRLLTPYDDVMIYLGISAP